jgi:pyruvate-formate lyase-activating enzyme
MVQATLAPANGRRGDPAHTAEKILHALSLLTQPGQIVELRIPGIQGKRTDSGYFDDPEKLARAALAYTGRAEGVYITLNPLHPALLARSSNRMTEYAKNWLRL